MKHRKRKGDQRLLCVPGAAMMLAALLWGGATEAAPPGACDVQLILEPSPEVPNPSDSGFLSSLLSHPPDYYLIFQGWRDDSTILVELTGPGPAYLCRQAIDTVRKDGRIVSVHLNN
jgi:hypothetical protein